MASVVLLCCQCAELPTSKEHISYQIGTAVVISHTWSSIRIDMARMQPGLRSYCMRSDVSCEEESELTVLVSRLHELLVEPA